MDVDDEPVVGIEDADVLNKYKMAGEMASRVMKQVVALCVDGASTLEICTKGDALILEEVAPVFNKKVDGRAIQKGIGFPVCLSINNVVCHYSPIAADEAAALKNGDTVKIDLGVHVDGFIAVCAHTLTVGADAAKPVSGRQADAVLAAYYACEAAARMVKPGVSSAVVTKVISDVAKAYDCTPIEDMLCFQLEQFRINGEKSIIQNPSERVRKDHKDVEFEVNEVYAVDVLISTGEGKARPHDIKTTVYKQSDETYSLKGKHARSLFAQVQKDFNNMPFSLRPFEGDLARVRMGLKECVEHELLEPYQILFEKDGEYVAQFRTTVLLLPNGNIRVTNSDFDPAAYNSEHKVEDKAILETLQTSLSTKSKKKKKKSKKPAAKPEAKE